MVEFSPIADLISRLPDEGAGRMADHNRRIMLPVHEDVRSPFGDGASREDLLEAWDERREDRSLEWLEELEADERSKVGPLSLRMSAEERLPSLAEYQMKRSGRHVRPAAFNRVAANFRRLNLQVQPLSESFNRMPKDTNLGAPWFSRQRKYASSYLDRAASIITGGYREDIFPFVWFARGQMAGPTATRNRDVWGSDHAETILSGTWVDPIVKALSTTREFVAWNDLDTIDFAVTRILHEAGNLPVFSGDFSGFDKRLTQEILEDAAAICALAFGDNEGNSRIRWSLRQLLEVGIITPWGVMLRSDGGMPSGVLPTNLLDGLCHWLAAEDVADQLGVRLVLKTFMGDDGLWVFDPAPPMLEVSAAFADLGFISNPEKTSVEIGRCHFLQRVHSLDSLRDGVARGIRSTFRTLGSAMSHENRINPKNWGPWMHSTRWYMQWENNRWHPDFKQFVEFLLDNDDYSRRVADPGEAVTRAGGIQRVKATLKLEGFPFNFRDPLELDNFETVRILRELRTGGPLPNL